MFNKKKETCPLSRAFKLIRTNPIFIYVSENIYETPEISFYATTLPVGYCRNQTAAFSQTNPKNAHRCLDNEKSGQDRP